MLSNRIILSGPAVHEIIHLALVTRRTATELEAQGKLNQIGQIDVAWRDENNTRQRVDKLLVGFRGEVPRSVSETFVMLVETLISSHKRAAKLCLTSES